MHHFEGIDSHWVLNFNIFTFLSVLSPTLKITRTIDTTQTVYRIWQNVFLSQINKVKSFPFCLPSEQTHSLLHQFKHWYHHFYVSLDLFTIIHISADWIEAGSHVNCSKFLLFSFMDSPADLKTFHRIL